MMQVSLVQPSMVSGLGRFAPTVAPLAPMDLFTSTASSSQPEQSKLHRGLSSAGALLGGFGGAIGTALATGTHSATTAALISGPLVGFGIGLGITIVTLGLGMISIPIGVGVGAAKATGGSWPLATVGGVAGYIVGGWAGGTLADIIEGAQGRK
jgi:hypothetical protein